ncbi:MAG: GIY-YIG nuclease family protein [Acetobacteraceae bacterium]
MRGWVYALASDGCPGLLKIGRTTADPKLRAQDATRRAVAAQWTVVFQLQVTDANRTEGALRLRLRDRSTPDGYDSFRTDLPTVIRHLETILGHKIDPEAARPPEKPKGRRELADDRYKRMVQRVRIAPFYDFLCARHDDLLGLNIAQILALYEAEGGQSGPFNRRPSPEYAAHEWTRVRREIAAQRHDQMVARILEAPR